MNSENFQSHYKSQGTPKDQDDYYALPPSNLLMKIK